MSKLYERNQEEDNVQNIDEDDYEEEYCEPVASGNLVDDILNGVHQDSARQMTENLLETEEDVGHQIDDIDLLN